MHLKNESWFEVQFSLLFIRSPWTHAYTHTHTDED